MIYNCLQATVRPFKHLNESQLDSFSVLLLMGLFIASINNDFMTAMGSSFPPAAQNAITLIMFVLVVLATAQAKGRTATNIKRMIARDRWKSAWSHMSGDECDPLADVGKLVNDFAEDANKKTGLLAKIGQIGIASVKLPIFEQIDIDNSDMISLDEFLSWWSIRTVRTGMADEMREVATDLFGRFDSDQSGEVDRDEFDQILSGLREWHATQASLMEQVEDSPEVRKERILIEREKVVANMHRHGWSESPKLGWVRPENAEASSSVAGMMNPLAASFEVESSDRTADAALVATPTDAGVPSVEEIFESIDTDRSGRVSYPEFSSWWTSHGGKGSALALAKRAFDHITQRDGVPDVSADGLKDVMVAVASDHWQQAVDGASGRQYYVNPTTGESSWLVPGIEVVAPFLTAAGITRSAATTVSRPPTLTEIFEEIDYDGSGELSFEEFADWWELNGGNQVSLALAQEAFGLVEMRDGVPGLGLDELKEVLIAVASDDWEEAIDQATSRKYFLNPNTGESSWLVPGIEVVGPFLERSGITRAGVWPAARTRAAALGVTARPPAHDQQGSGLPAVQPQPVGSAWADQQPASDASAREEPVSSASLAAPRQIPIKADAALMQARVVDRVIAALDTTGRDSIQQSSFVEWWADRQVAGLPVMDKLKFSRPFLRAFSSSNDGAISAAEFRALLLVAFDAASPAERTASHLEAWLQGLLQLD